MMGRVARIGCLMLLLAMTLLMNVVSAAGTSSSKNNRHQHASKSRLIKTDSVVHQDSTTTTTPSSTTTTIKSLDGINERRVRKRSKWIQQSTSHHHQGSASSAAYFNKDGTFLKRIVTEVIAERDAQIAAALFEVAKNQPHLQMMVQTLGELSQSNQRLELSSTRLDETQRRLDSRLGVISEKMTLLETRLSQTERRIEREMTQIHGKMDDVFRNLPDKSPESLMRGVKQIQDQLTVIEEILLGSASNQIRGKNRHKSGLSSAELHKVSNNLSQAIAAVHLDLGRIIREAETNLDHQLSMLASDNGVFSCAISKLLDRATAVTAVDPAGNLTLGRQLLEANSIQTADLLTFDQLANNSTKCLLKCP